MSCRLLRFSAFALGALCSAACQQWQRSEKIADEPPPFRLENSTGQDERIVTDVRINGHSARLALDTGCEAPFFLFAPNVSRFGLTIDRSPPPDINPTPGIAQVGFTAPTEIKILGQTLREVPVAFSALPPEIAGADDADGIIGWPAVSKNFWAFDFSGEKPEIAFVENFSPVNPGWIDFSVPDASTLSLKFATSRPDLPRLIIDTGASGGVMLPPARWREWKAAHPEAPIAIHATHFAGQKLAVSEVAWADEIHVGDLVFRGVPVAEADAAYLRDAAEGEEIVALGLAALKRLVLIIDGRAKIAHAHDLDNPPPPYPHNRTGVEFLPGDGPGDDLFAHVLTGSPAFRAGVRDGDLLLSVNGQDVAGWLKIPGRLSKFFPTRSPAGTKWDLKVRRDGTTPTFHVVAEDLLGPDVKRAH